VVKDAQCGRGKGYLTALRIGGGTELVDCGFDALGGEMKGEWEAWKAATDNSDFWMRSGGYFDLLIFLLSWRLLYSNRERWDFLFRGKFMIFRRDMLDITMVFFSLYTN
jgi:hypothetical protein